MMTEIDRSYLAGFVDGEGCLTLIRDSRSNGSVKVFPNINVCNTNYSIIRWIQGTTGIGIIRTRKRNGNHKDSYEIHFRVPEIINFLDIVEPYLRIKKRQAEILRNFMEVKGKSGDNQPVDLEIFTQRIRLLYEIQELNRKGP